VEREIEFRVDDPNLKLKDLPSILNMKIGGNVYNYTTHGTRTSELAIEIGREMGLDGGDIELLSKAAMTHDVGKIFLPASLVLKPGVLTGEEYVTIKEHVHLGADYLRRSGCSSVVVDAALHHHEKFDGSGYPDGLSGENIMLYTRIISAADAFDAMVSKEQGHVARHREVDDAWAEIKRNSGRQFDPKVVNAMEKVLKRRGIIKS